MGKNSLGQSPAQGLEVGPRWGPYLMVTLSVSKAENCRFQNPGGWSNISLTDTRTNKGGGGRDILSLILY